MVNRLIRSLPVLAACSGIVADELRWRNGDVMPGTLLDGGAGQVRWSGPHWPEPWVLETRSLESVAFDIPATATGGSWRILTYAGDSLLADLEGADDHDFHISSPILGASRIRRESVRMMERLHNTDRVFLAESYMDWVESDRGPILDLRYRIHRPGEGWDREGEFPDFDGMEPLDEGSLPDGRIDLGVVSFDGPRGVVFEGEIELRDTPYSIDLRAGGRDGEARNWARLTVGNRSLVDLDRREDVSRRGASRIFRARSGRYPLRFEYLGDTAEATIHAGLRPGTGTGGRIRNGAGNPHSLMSMGAEPVPGWFAGVDGRLSTTEHAAVVRPLVIPGSFELELDLSSRSDLRFILGLGPIREAVESFDAFRLETWDEALVVTRDQSFRTLRILEEEDRNLRLSLYYDNAARHLQVFGSDGTLLSRWEGARIDPGPSGICLINKGEDLAVGRIRLARIDGGPEFIGFDRSRVRLTGGTVLPGTLRHDADTGAWSVVSGEERRALDPERMDRVVHPPREMSPVLSDAVLTYGRGTRLKGRLQEVTPEAMILSTELSDDPVVCSRDGLTSLLFLSPDHRSPLRVGELKTGTYSLKGTLDLKEGEDPLWWLPEGARQSQPITTRITGRIELQQTVSGVENHPHRIRLHGKKSIFCRLISLDEEQLEIDAFLLGRRTIASRHVRAIEFDPGSPIPDPPDEDRGMATPEFLEGIESSRQGGPSGPYDDGEVRRRVEQALRIPRFQREAPPTHLVVARNGDVDRGNLIAIDQDALRLRSRLREKFLERDLVRLVVRITEPERMEGADRFRVLLLNGMLLGGESVSSDGENLVLESLSLGRCVIPLPMIRELTLGDFEVSRYLDPYRNWVMRPTGPGVIE